MTKGKQKLVEKAKKYGFTEKEMELVCGDNPIYVTDEIVYGINRLINTTPEDEIVSRVSIVLDTYNTYLNQDVKYNNLDKKYILRDLFGFIDRPLNDLIELCKEIICPDVIEYITNVNNYFYFHVLSFTDDVEIARNLSDNFKKNVSFFKPFRCNKESQNTIMSDYKKNKNNSFLAYLFTQERNIHSDFLEESVEIYNHSDKNKSLKEVVLPYISVYKDISLEIDKKKLYTEMIKSNKYYGFIKQHYPKYTLGTFYSEKLFHEDVYKIPEDISATFIILSLGSSKIDISDSKGVFNIEFYNYSNTSITKYYDANNGNLKNSINPTGKKVTLRLVLFPDGGIYQKSRDRLIPLQMKNLKYISKDNKYAREFLNYICKDYDLGKDFLEDCDESCLIPISYQDITIYHIC